MRSGRIGVAQAQLLGKAFANPRCGPQLVDVMDIMLRHAAFMPYADFRRVVEHWERLADVDGAHRHADAVHRDRHARVRVTSDRVEFEASGGTASGAMLAEVFDRFCRAEFLTDWERNRQIHGDGATAATMPRTARQRRYDALVAIFERAAGSPVDASTPEPVVNVHVDAHTLDVMMNGERATTPAPDDPRERRCETLSGIPLTPADALSACLWGRIRRVVTDADGVVIDMGRSARLFTGAAREAVMMQSTQCVMAGCVVPVGDCQADHVHDWYHGGCTDCHNGCPLCGFHNRLKSARGFAVRRDEHGYWHTYRPDGTEITDAFPLAGELDAA